MLNILCFISPFNLYRHAVKFGGNGWRYLGYTYEAALYQRKTAGKRGLDTHGYMLKQSRRLRHHFGYHPGGLGIIEGTCSKALSIG